MRGGTVHTEPTIDTYSHYVGGGGDAFGAYQGTQIQGDEPVSVRKGINPTIRQVRMGPHFGVLGTDLKKTKMSETTMRNTLATDSIRILRIHLGSIIRRCARYWTNPYSS